MKWVKSEESLDKQIEKLWEEHAHVVIYENDETGETKWSVALPSSEFWLDSFDTKMEALDYCLVHKLPYKILLTNDNP